MRGDGGGVTCRHGVFRFPADAYIGRSLETYGEYCEHEVRLLCSLLHAGDVVVEAGAHVGALTVPMARAVGPAGFVLAFEPQGDIAEMLMANARDNGVSVRVSVEALGAAPADLCYQANAFNTGGVELEPYRDCDFVAVRGVTLDSFALPRVDLIKADVEGMEADVLAGAEATVLRCRPVIYCENDRAHRSRRLFDLLFAWGYRVWRHEGPLYSADNFRGVSADAWPGVCSMNLLAVPEERPAPAAAADLPEVKRGQWAAVCRFGGVGDNLAAAAVLPGLVRQGNRVEVITSSHAGELFDNNPWVDKLSICQDGDQPDGGGIEWQRWFQKRGHEYRGGLFHLSHTIETTLAFVQGQTQFWWSDRARRSLAARSYLDLAIDVCGTAHELGAPLYYPTAAERARAAATKAAMGPRVVAWVLCGTRLDKVYPYAPFVVARLIKELGVAVMLSGAPDGHAAEQVKPIEDHVRRHNGSVDGLFTAMTVTASANGPARDWPLRRGLAQLLACDLVIGPDTGGLWACAFEAMPKIVLLSHASPLNIVQHWRNTLPLFADQKRVPCWPCHRLHDSIETCRPNAENSGAACISDIGVDVIVDAARRALKGAAQ